MTNTMKYHIFQIHTGYVESASLGSIAFTHDEGFDTPLDGLYQLGLDIAKAKKEVYGWHTRAYHERMKRLGGKLPLCCEASLAANPSLISCAKCCMEIAENNKKITIQDVNDEIDLMMRSDNDSYGYDMVECLNNLGWMPGSEDIHGPSSTEHVRVHAYNFSWNPNFKNNYGTLEVHLVKVVSVSDNQTPYKGWDETTDEEEIDSRAEVVIPENETEGD